MNGGCRFAQNKIDKCSIGFVFWMVVGEGGKKEERRDVVDGERSKTWSGG